MTDPAYHPGYLQPGQTFWLWRNQGWRLATCLAVKRYSTPGAPRDDRSADKALVEYEMPQGSTALNIIPADGSDMRRSRKQIPYKRVGKAWLEAIIANGLNWIGRPQQHQGKPPVASVVDMLARYDQRAAERSDSTREGA